MVGVPWWFLSLSGDRENGLAGWMRMRLGQLENVLRTREWLAASRFTVADLLMADFLRVPKVRDFAASPVINAYIDRACDREAFRKAFADQLAHFQAADESKREIGSASWRDRVCQNVSLSVGAGSLKQKNDTHDA